MPYIKKEEQLLFKNLISSLLDEKIETTGQLNFILTTICNAYVEHKGESYQIYNDVLGALEGCKLELYRRLISKYEDKKIAENGDLYE